MAANRYHDLLGVPEEVTNPDYYVLLGVPAGTSDPARLEEAFRERMGRLQQVRTHKHKEFVEFLKGEIKNARRTLSDAKRRSDYDRMLVEERKAEVAKFVGHVIVDGLLSSAAERSLLQEGRKLGLSEGEVTEVIDSELAARDACRGELEGQSAEGFAEVQQRLKGFAAQAARAAAQARYAMRQAQQSALREKTATAQAEKATQQAKQATARVRSAVVREQKAMAIMATEKKKAEHLMQRVTEREREILTREEALAQREEELIDEAESLRRRGAAVLFYGCVLLAVVVAALAVPLLPATVRAALTGARDGLLAWSWSPSTGVLAGIGVAALVVAGFAVFLFRRGQDLVGHLVLTLLAAGILGLFYLAVHGNLTLPFLPG